jgi:hypothetical protein
MLDGKCTNLCPIKYYSDLDHVCWPCSLGCDSCADGLTCASCLNTYVTDPITGHVFVLEVLLIYI